jgi:hypothetical protein
MLEPDDAAIKGGFLIEEKEEKFFTHPYILNIREVDDIENKIMPFFTLIYTNLFQTTLTVYYSSRI